MIPEISLFLTLLKALLNVEEKQIATPSEVNWERIIKFAKQHNLQNLLYYGVEKLEDAVKPDAEIIQKLYQMAMREVALTYNQIEAANEIFEAFEQNRIKVLAVKGICTKNQYPQPDYRTMGDIDLLYCLEQHAQMKVVMDGLGYSQNEEGRKHDSFSKPPYIGVEMHRELLATDSEYYSYYQNIWEKAHQKDGYEHVYELNVEDEYIFNIVHLVEHFINGGVGMRFIMDIYVYSCLETMNWSYIEEELKKLSLWEFHQNVYRLSQNWFGDSSYIEQNEVLKEMEQYIIENGVFGTKENKAASAVAKGGKIKFLFQTLFPDYKSMKSMFPWLGKWPILLPVSWVIRGVRSFLFRRKNIKTQWSKFKTGNEEYGKKLEQFYNKCGLM